MRLTLFVLCGALVAAGAFVAVKATSPIAVARSSEPESSLGTDKAAFGKSIREYLMANPEVLVDAMQELERRQDSERDAVAQKAIEKSKDLLFSDPASPFVGNPNGDVTIVEFSDYQCPYCKKVYATLKKVVSSDGKVKLVYKDLPILGEASKIAARAALASVKQGKHDAFHDELMEFNGRLDSDRIFEIAKSVGLDVAVLKKDMEDPKIKEQIERNLDLASELGVRGTPAFVIGKQFVPGAIDTDALKQYIADARKG